MAVQWGDNAVISLENIMVAYMAVMKAALLAYN